MMKISFLCYFFAIISLSFSAFAEQCPAINCDCSSLSTASWANACRDHEKRIKKACMANANVPKDYCALHGPAAKPVALSLTFDPLAGNGGDTVAKVDEKIAAVYWAIYADTDQARKSFEANSYARTMQILNLVDTNIAQLFNLQRQAEALISESSDAAALAKAWRKYGEDSHKYAKKLAKFGADIAKKVDGAGSAKQRKIFIVLSQKTLRMAGKGFEHAGYALGLAGRHKPSAKSWQQAAAISEHLLAIDETAGVKATGVKFTQLQAAARLYRASYHWLLNEDFDDSIEQLENAQAFVDKPTVENIAPVIAAEKEAEKDRGFLNRLSDR